MTNDSVFSFMENCFDLTTYLTVVSILSRWPVWDCLFSCDFSSLPAFSFLLQLIVSFMRIITRRLVSFTRRNSPPAPAAHGAFKGVARPVAPRAGRPRSAPKPSAHEAVPEAPPKPSPKRRRPARSAARRASAEGEGGECGGGGEASAEGVADMRGRRRQCGGGGPPWERRPWAVRGGGGGAADSHGPFDCPLLLARLSSPDRLLQRALRRCNVTFTPVKMQIEARSYTAAPASIRTILLFPPLLPPPLL